MKDDLVLDKFIVNKTVEAARMTKGEFIERTGRDMSHCSLPQDADGYFIQYPDGYVSWAPEEVFEATSRLTTTGGMTFGEAIESLKQGQKVARKGWNGKAMFLSLSRNEEFELEADKFWSPHNAEFAKDNGGTATVLPCITMKTADNKVLMGWLASQTDMLAEDWVIV